MIMWIAFCLATGTVHTMSYCACWVCGQPGNLCQF